MTFRNKRKTMHAPHSTEAERPDFSSRSFPGSEAVSREARRQTILLGSHRRGIKKAPIALAAATVASMLAAGWGTTAQAQEATDPNVAPVVTTQQAKAAGEVAEEVAKQEQDPANESWIEKALASILEGDVAPFVTLADAMLAGVGGENLAQATDGDEGSKDESEELPSSGSGEEQSEPKSEAPEDAFTQTNGGTSERATPGGATKDAEEETAQAPSGSFPEEDDRQVGGAENPTAKQGSTPKPEAGEASAPPGGAATNRATEPSRAFSSESSPEDDSPGIEQTGESSTRSSASTSSSKDADLDDEAMSSESENAPGSSGKSPSSGTDESSGGSYEDDAPGSARGNVSPAPEESPFGFTPTEVGGPPEGTPREEIGASDESKKAVENYLESGEEEYLEDSLEKDIEDKTIPSETRVPENEDSSFAKSEEETDEGQQLGESSGFGALQEDVEETSSEQEDALEETSSEEAPDAERGLPTGGFEAVTSSGEEQSSRSGVPEALRVFLEAVEQNQSADELAEGGGGGQEQVPADDSADTSQGALPAAARPDNADSEGEAGTPFTADGGREQTPPVDAPVPDQEQPEKEEQGAPAVEQREEVPEQDRQRPVGWTRASDRAQAVQPREQAQSQEQQLSQEGGVSQAAPREAQRQEEPKQRGPVAGPETDGVGTIEQSIPVLGASPDQIEPSDEGGVSIRQSSTLGPGQEGLFTVKDNDRFEQRPLDYAASFTPGRVTVDGVGTGDDGPSDPESTEAPTQHDVSQSGDDADAASDDVGPSWRAAGGDLPSTPVQPTPDQADAPSSEPEIRTSDSDAADQVGRSGGGYDLGDRDSGAPEARGGGETPDGGGSGGDREEDDKG